MFRPIPPRAERAGYIGTSCSWWVSPSRSFTTCAFLWTTLISAALIPATTGVSLAGITVTAAGGNNQHRTDLANILTAVTGTQVTIAANGVMSIADGGNGCAGILRGAINAAQMVTLNVGRNMNGVGGGLFHGTDSTPDTKTTGTQDIDLDDIEKLGNDNTAGGLTRGSTLMHEIWEVIISLRDQIPYHDYVDGQGKTQEGAHTKAIKDCENGYYAAMAPQGTLPTVRLCRKDVILGSGDLMVYMHFKRGGSNQVEGWSCLPVHVSGPSIQFTGAPTFVAGAEPPDHRPEGPLPVGAMDVPGMGAGPLEGFNCPVQAVPATPRWGAVALALLLVGSSVGLLRNRSTG